MKVRLIRKLADRLDGIDLSGFQEGDVAELATPHARLLIAEHWASPVEESAGGAEVRGRSSRSHRATAADGPRRGTRTAEQLRRIREHMEQRQLAQQEHRRAEDLIREELQDSRARTVSGDD